MHARIPGRQKKLLTNYKLKKKLISYFHPRESQKIPRIIHLLKQGHDVALVSDAGTPGLSDPGYPLIREAINQGLKIIPLPGASAVTAALSASGLPTHRFLFLGFPPSKKEATKKTASFFENRKRDSCFLSSYSKTCYFFKDHQGSHWQWRRYKVFL